MRYLLSEHAQGTPEWLQARAGKATGSRASDIVAKIKTGEAAARRDYRIQLVTEIISGVPAEDGYVNKEMIWGSETEPYARSAYEAATGALVREAGFAYLPDINAGCSVDGFIDEGDKTGILECKCPKSATHIGYLLAGKVPPAYVPQIVHNLWVTGTDFADFVSFDPRLPEHLQFFLVRFDRVEGQIAAHEAEVKAFLADVQETVDRLGRMAA
jgi:predicted phage-related endonuclease